MHLARFPRVRLGHFPTPLEPLPQLSKALGGPTIWIKRDDCTGLATGGNKTRKLEFLLADALQQGADVVLTQGATQSNHVRQTIAGAARLGLTTQVLLERRVNDFGEEYQRSGNVLLDDLLGGVIVDHLPGGTDMQQALETLAAQLRDQGHKPYVIPGGGSNAIGALGYVACAEELLWQSSQQQLRIDHVVHAWAERHPQRYPGAWYQRAGAEGQTRRKRVESGAAHPRIVGHCRRVAAQCGGRQR